MLAGLDEQHPPADDGQPVTVTRPPPEAIEPLLQELQNRIERNSFDALDILEQLRPLMAGTSSEAHFQRIAKAVTGYDFDAAATLIGQLPRMPPGTHP